MNNFNEVFKEASQVGICLNDFAGLTKESQIKVLTNIKDDFLIILAMKNMDELFIKSVNDALPIPRLTSILSLNVNDCACPEEEIMEAKSYFLEVMLELKKKDEIILECEIIL